MQKPNYLGDIEEDPYTFQDATQAFVQDLVPFLSSRVMQVRVVETSLPIFDTSLWWSLTEWRDIGGTTEDSEPSLSIQEVKIGLPEMIFNRYNSVDLLEYEFIFSLRLAQYRWWRNYIACNDSTYDEYEIVGITKDSHFFMDNATVYNHLENLYQDLLQAAWNYSTFDPLTNTSKPWKYRDFYFSPYYYNTSYYSNLESFWNCVGASVSLQNINDFSELRYVPRPEPDAPDFSTIDITSTINPQIYNYYWQNIGTPPSDLAFMDANEKGRIRNILGNYSRMYTDFRFKLNSMGRPIVVPLISSSWNISRPLERLMDYYEMCLASAYWTEYAEISSSDPEILKDMRKLQLQQVVEGVLIANGVSFLLNPMGYLSEYAVLKVSGGDLVNKFSISQWVWQFGKEVFQEMILEDAIARGLSHLGLGDSEVWNILAEIIPDFLEGQINAFKGEDYLSSGERNLFYALEDQFVQKKIFPAYVL